MRWLRSSLVTTYVFVVALNINMAGFYALAPTFKDDLGLSGTQRDVLFAGSGLAMLLAALPTGSLSDRFGARRVSMVAMWLLVLSAVGHAVAVDFWSLLGARIVFALAFTGMLTASMAWLSDSVDVVHRARAIGGIMPSAATGMLIGPYLAGALADASSIELAYAVLAAISLVPLVQSFWTPRIATRPVGGTPLAQMLRALGQPVVAAAVILNFLGIGIDVAINLLVPQQLDDNGLGAAARGAILSGGGVVFVLTALLLLRRANGVVNLRTAALAATLMGLVLIPLAVSEATVPQAVGTIVRGGIFALVFVVSYPLGALGALAGGLAIGASAGLMMLATGLGNTIGPITAGRIADGIGSGAFYALLAVIAVLAGAWMAWLSRRVSFRPADEG
ncbi:MAG: MFS transporter [Thermoleophilia bacterium]